MDTVREKIEKAKKFFNDIEDQGYSYGAPSYEAEKFDERVANEAKCDKCGYNGLRYHPFSKPGSYRAFTLCPECGNIDEF